MSCCFRCKGASREKLPMPRSSGSVGTEAGGREDRSAPSSVAANFLPVGARGCRHLMDVGQG